MMKKILLLSLLCLSLGGSKSAFAGYCWVTTESEYNQGTCESGSTCSTSSLRYMIERSYNSGASNCTPPSTSGSLNDDYDYFDKVILFATYQSGNCGDYNSDGDCNDSRDVFIDTIELNGPMTFEYGSHSIAIGNWTGDIADTDDMDYSDTYLSLLDSGGEYGNVEIDASGLASGQMPFECDGTDELWLRNLTITLPGGITESEFWSDCRKNGGDVTLVNAEDDDTCTATTETCDGIDNDCDGSIDENLPTNTFYYDEDGDGAGDDSNTETSCESSMNGYVTTGGDCDDSDASRSPNYTELCNSYDDDCDNLVDEDDGSGGTCDGDVEICDDAAGADEDGNGKSNCDDDACETNAACQTTETACADGADNDGDDAQDCEDSDCSGNAACVEDCDDTAEADEDGDGDANCDDSDCSASTACTAADVDGDGSDSTLDCNDNDDTIYPGAGELCGSCTNDLDTSTCVADGVDQDCDGLIDEGCNGSPNVDDDGDGLSENAGDCDDTDDGVSPDATELCDDGVDNNCDGEDVSSTSDEFLNGSLTCDISAGASKAVGGCGCHMGEDAPDKNTLIGMMIALGYMGVLMIVRKKSEV